MNNPKYTMRISRMTVDKLGVKLYDRVYSVIAELISNSYDADAEKVIITAPMGQYLAIKQDGKVLSKNVEIVIEDDGVGMTPEQLQSFYLIVGSERRNDPHRGDKSKKFSRAVMGRKGVGKLAPFGVCRRVEILTAGGDLISDEQICGYKTAHIILDKDAILSDDAESYIPTVGPLDETISEKTFTKVKLSDFDYRRVGKIEELSRQLAQRFGIASPNWEIILVDSSKTPSDPEHSLAVGSLEIPVMENSRISFLGPTPTLGTRNFAAYKTTNPDGTTNTTLSAGFMHDGIFYPITGWIAYSKEPYKDELMVGVRIYCRGKFAAQTALFNKKAGFTGEHTIRSYLIGEIYADWLDEQEDLIQTDRRDILWSHELGACLQDWGQRIVQHIGKITRDPMRISMANRFFEEANVVARISDAFPQVDQKDLRRTAETVAKIIGKSMRGDEFTDPEALEDMLQLTLLLAPLKNLDEKLREAGDSDAAPLRIVNDILRTAKVAEAYTFGHQIEKRIKIIDRLETIKDSNDSDEAELQKLIETAPWLLNPQWIPVTANQSFNTLKSEFEKYFKEKTGEEIQLQSLPDKKKRPDFVCLSQDSKLQLIEIKRPKHAITNEEMDRIVVYYEQLENFFADHKHSDFRHVANDFLITLVSDGERLKGAQKAAYNMYLAKQRLQHIDWATFLLRTKRTHQEFLDSAQDIKRHEK